MARRRSTRRGKGEGSVFEQANGTWRGKVTVNSLRNKAIKSRGMAERWGTEAYQVRLPNLRKL